MRITALRAKDNQTCANQQCVKTSSCATNRLSSWEIVKCPDGVVERLSGFIQQLILDKKYFDDGGFIDEHFNDGDWPWIKALILNNQTPFVTFWPCTDGCLASINYPSLEIQPEERSLLEQWFDYVVTTGWPHLPVLLHESLRTKIIFFHCHQTF